MRVLDLFSGIGGFSLGLERAGMKTVAFCEIEEYPRQVLAKHWPNVPIYDDVRTLTADTLRRDGIAVDLICGGFPCQDLSLAGNRAGLEGERSGLWGEYRRIIGELRPRFVIVENVPGLLSLGLSTVLGDLAALGYDAVWNCIPASAVGAPHRRDRVWIIAYAAGARRLHAKDTGAAGEDTAARDRNARARERDGKLERVGSDVADADKLARNEGRASDATQRTRGRHADRGSVGATVRNSNVSRLALREGQSRDVGEEFAPSIGTDWWLSEPNVGRVADGVPARVDRLKGLGNAVVPQIPEMIGRAIMAAV